MLQNFGELCNGSTTDSDSVCWGSNPYSPAKIKRYHPIGWCLFVLVKFIIGIRTRREQSLIAEENSPVDCFRRRGQRAYARRQVRQHRKNPYSPAKIKRYHPIGWCLFVLVKFIIGIRTRREQSLIAEENSPVDCFRRRGQRAYARRQVRQHRKNPYSPASRVPRHANA